ncbi:MAG: hypothetical protein ACRYHA_34180 [Janthinobacterium lividum]
MSNFRVTVRTAAGVYRGRGACVNQQAALAAAQKRFGQAALAIVVVQVRA